MAVLPVTLCEMLRPWYYAGISHLWPDPEAPEPGPELEEILRPVSSSRAAGRRSGEAPGHGAYGRSGAGGREKEIAASGARADGSFVGGAAAVDAPRQMQHSAQHPAARPASGRGTRPTASANAAGRGAGAPSSSDRLSSGGGRATSPLAPAKAVATLSPARRALLDRTTGAPLLWTYPELGADLSGRGNAERSARLKALIGALHLPRGTNCFWPLRLPGEDPAEATAQFQAGLERLDPRAVILFGAESVALCGASLATATPFTQRLHAGRLYLLLPGMPELVAAPALTAPATDFLSGQVSGLPGLTVVRS